MTWGQPDQDRSGFLDGGRVVAALLVLYGNLVWTFLPGSGGENPVTDTVGAFVRNPLLLGSQGVTSLAVAFFFLASGYLVTPMARTLGAGRFAANRLLRLAPLYVFTVLLAAALLWWGGRPLTAGRGGTVGVRGVLENLTMTSFLDIPASSYLGVAWTLLVEVLFYVLVVSVLPLLRRAPWLAIAVELEVVQLLLAGSTRFGDHWHAFVALASFLIVPVMGQIVWAGWHGAVRPWAAWLLLAVAWLEYVWANARYIDPERQPFPLAAALALVGFCAGVFAGTRLRPTRLGRALAERSYSLFLVQGVALFPVTWALRPVLPLWAALLLGLAVLAVGVEVCHRLVERPSHRLARRFSRPPPYRCDAPAVHTARRVPEVEPD